MTETEQQAPVQDETDASDAPFPRVTVSGDFTDRVNTVSNASMSVVVGLGRTAEKGDVLLPFIDLKFISYPDGTEASAVFSTLTTLENVAYLLADMSGDFQRACEQVGRLAAGDVGLEPGRANYSIDRVTDAVRLLSTAVEELRGAVREG